MNIHPENINNRHLLSKQVLRLGVLHLGLITYEKHQNRHRFSLPQPRLISPARLHLQLKKSVGVSRLRSNNESIGLKSGIRMNHESYFPRINFKYLLQTCDVVNQDATVARMFVLGNEQRLWR